MEGNLECEMTVRNVTKKTVVTSSTITTSSGRKRSLVEIVPKGEPFPNYDVKLVPGERKNSTKLYELNNNDSNNNQSSLLEQPTKTVEEGRRSIGQSRKCSDHVSEQPIMIVTRGRRSRIEVPEWMEERKCPETEYQPSDISDIDDLLKYPADYSPREKEIDDNVEEDRIHPEFTKRNKQLVPVISDKNGVSESDEDSSEFEEEIVVVEVQRKPSWNKKLESPRQVEVPEWIKERKSSGTECQPIDGLLKYPTDYSPTKGEIEDNAIETWIHPVFAKRDEQVFPVLLDENGVDDSGEESSEFEEEIVVMDVKRKPSWNKKLVFPKQGPESAGKPIEDLLVAQTIRVQESAPDELLTEEKIECVERPSVFREVPDFAALENL